MPQRTCRWVALLRTGLCRGGICLRVTACDECGWGLFGIWGVYGSPCGGDIGLAGHSPRPTLGFEQICLHATCPDWKVGRCSLSSAEHHFHSCCSGVVQTPRLGMEIGCRNHFHAGGRRPRKSCKGRLSAGCHGRYNRGRIVVLFAPPQRPHRISLILNGDLQDNSRNFNHA
jgi:hypothetical protein